MHFRLDSLQSLGWIAHVCTLGRIALNIIGLESPCMYFRLDSQTHFIAHAAT